MNYPIAFKNYPSRLGHRGEDGRGPLRTGRVLPNDDTIKAGIDDFFAAVTHEQDGTVRFYILTISPDEPLFQPFPNMEFPNTVFWKGPYTGLSEEIETLPDEVLE